MCAGLVSISQIKHPALKIENLGLIAIASINISQTHFDFQCRERGISYRGKLQVTLVWKVNGQVQDSVERIIGEVPIMVKVSHVQSDRMTDMQCLGFIVAQ